MRTGELTPDWLAETLGLEAGPIVDVEWERIGEAHGFAGLVLRGLVRYEDGGTASLVAKQGDREELVAREERFYREVGAALAPGFLGAADGILLLEDVGGRQGDVLVGCSVEEAGLVLEAVTELHAAECGGRDGFPRWDADGEGRQERYARRVDAFLQAYGWRLPTSAIAIVEALRTQLAGVVAELAAGPPTLIHGDLHLDNVLFGADERPVVVLDWQLAAVGPPAWDIALFLYGSLGVEQRRAAEDGLLERCAAVLGRRTAELRHECALALLVQLAGVVGWLSRPGREGASQRELAVRAASLGDGRLLAALADHAEGVVRLRA